MSTATNVLVWPTPRESYGNPPPDLVEEVQQERGMKGSLMPDLKMPGEQVEQAVKRRLLNRATDGDDERHDQASDGLGFFRGSRRQRRVPWRRSRISRHVVSASTPTTAYGDRDSCSPLSRQLITDRDVGSAARPASDGGSALSTTRTTRRLKSVVADLATEKDLLKEKIRHLETSGPLGWWRSKR
jgi:hypothetical protein